MKQFNKIFLTLFFQMVLTISLFAQKNFFNNVNANKISFTGKRTIEPQKCFTTEADVSSLKLFLWNLPIEKNIDRKTAPILELPMPDGSTAKFNVWESSIQEPALQSKFSEIRTFAGQGIDDPSASIRFDYTAFGFHAQILSPNGNIYIDPFARGDVNYYMSYYNKDNIRQNPFVCETANSFGGTNTSNVTGACRGTQLNTYRLALACTGEYAVAVGGTTAALLHSAIVTSINRVDGVYENEVAVRLVLIANNNLIEYLDATTDPFTGNNNATTLISESQSVITSAIGSANFDIGHTFSTGGGGLAGLGVICTNSQKASGITGSPSPFGDGYDIDYVAHEMGHQFGGNHTFNSTTSNCGGGNRTASTAYEVGSGTTIQAYAGICGTDNIQTHSDPFFHTISFDEISNYIAGTGAGCAVITSTGNSIPVITAMNNNGANIPINTPFTLTAAATDANGDALTYCWEEWDLGTSGAWNNGAASTTAPLFKSRVPTTSGSRTFPDINVILAGYPSAPSATMGGLKGETLPTVARAIKFRLTVRDNRAGGGGVVTGGNGCGTFSSAFQINTIATTGPFAVTVPNGGETYAGGSVQTVTWNVVGTDVSPISVANVKISLSTDGGLTYPTVLLASTPNTGSASVTYPGTQTAIARIKVEAIGNIFFDISDANFTINQCTTFGGMAASGSSITLFQNSLTNYSIDCNKLIATVAQNGASPITSNTTAKIWVEATQPLKFVKRHFEITPSSNATTATGRITLYFTDGDFTAYNTQATPPALLLPISTDAAATITLRKANLLIEKRGGVSSDGTGLPSTYTGTVTTIDPVDADIVWNNTANRWEVSFDVVGFSGLFVKSSPSSLNVKWLNVSGNINLQKQATINWQVQEQNIAKYDIEKSIDGIQFTAIETTLTKGEGQNLYTYTEATKLVGTAFYRIKQIDKQGKIEYSKTIKLSTYDNALTVYPSPATHYISINGGVQLLNTPCQLYDMNGKLLQKNNISYLPYNIILNKLNRGVYILRFKNGEVRKIIKE